MTKDKTHGIQLTGLIDDDDGSHLILLGLIFIKDNDHITYNPCIKGYNNLRWTWHADGLVTTKENEKILQQHKRQRLDSFQKSDQFLSNGFPINGSTLKRDYKHIANSQIFTVDFRNFQSNQFNISIHVSAYNHVLKCSGIFSSELNHQTFIFSKSKPYIVVNFFEPKNQST